MQTSKLESGERNATVYEGVISISVVNCCLWNPVTYGMMCLLLWAEPNSPVSWWRKNRRNHWRQQEECAEQEWTVEPPDISILTPLVGAHFWKQKQGRHKGEKKKIHINPLNLYSPLVSERELLRKIPFVSFFFSMESKFSARNLKDFISFSSFSWEQSAISSDLL